MFAVGSPFRFEHRVEFQPDDAEAQLRSIPVAPGVFALRGEREDAQPYVTRAADMRRRLRRLLLPSEAATQPLSGTAKLPASDRQGDGHQPGNGQPVFSKRLNLRSRIRFIEWTRTGSEFESILLLYEATRAAFGAERARERLKLFPPFAVRLTLEHAHPRLYVTNRLSRKSLAESFGPFPSRAAAERYAEAVGDLFQLRRCNENLVVHPDHPGCAYGEMKRCLAPCKAAVSAFEYAAEAERVQSFLRTHGESLLHAVAAEREAASDAMDFEAAAALHARWEKVKAAASLADELVRPLPELQALVLQEAAPVLEEASGTRSEDAAVFLLRGARLTGPERLSTLGVRAVREQTAVGSSLFAQPLMLAAVPLDGDAAARSQSSTSGIESTQVAHEPAPAGEATLHVVPAVSLSPEDRARAVIERLSPSAAQPDELLAAEQAAEQGAAPEEARGETLGDVLALFRRWYYRPEKQRAGEVFLPNADGTWPLRRILNGAARVVLGPPAELSPVDREAAKQAGKTMRTRVLHPGREGVERVVPVLPKRGKRTRKAVLPGEALL